MTEEELAFSLRFSVNDQVCLSERVAAYVAPAAYDRMKAMYGGGRIMTVVACETVAPDQIYPWHTQYVDVQLPDGTVCTLGSLLLDHA